MSLVKLLLRELVPGILFTQSLQPLPRAMVASEAILLGNCLDIHVMRSTFEVVNDFGLPALERLASSGRTSHQLLPYIETQHLVCGSIE